MEMAMAAILLYALFFAGTHAEPTELLLTSQVPSILHHRRSAVAASSSTSSSVRSANAGMNYRTYSIIAADLLHANATSTGTKIDGLLRGRGGKGDEATTRSLRSCQALYGGVVQRQPGCAAAVRDRRDGEATRCLEKAAGAAECEDGFGKSKVASPVTMENDDAFKLAKLAVALLRRAY